MATQDNDDFLEEELVGQHIIFPPEVIAALDQVYVLKRIIKDNMYYPKKFYSGFSQ